MFERRREIANRHVATGRRIIEAQRRTVERLNRSGRPTDEAERLLALFESSVRGFEDDLEAVLRKEDK
jgi:hypothetical protein